MRKTIYADGFIVWLSAKDTRDWANKPSSASGWPCSFLAGKRVWVQYGSEGLIDITVNGKPAIHKCPAIELRAILSDLVDLPVGHVCKEFFE